MDKEDRLMRLLEVRRDLNERAVDLMILHHSFQEDGIDMDGEMTDIRGLVNGAVNKLFEIAETLIKLDK